MQNKGIIGAVCGDIIGSAYEFHKTKDVNFKLFTPRSKFTDDTVMTCAVAEWLVEDPTHSHEQLVKIMHRYGEEYPHAQVVLLQLSVKYLMIFLANVLTGLNHRWLMLLNGSTRFVVNNKVIIKSK